MPESPGKLQVFISWSLPLSRAVAPTLKDWLPRLIQSVDPWVSSEDIEKGTWWNQSIVEALNTSTVGIVVITPENLQRTWINFEAGALARAIGPAGGVVAPLLINVPGSSIEGPMGGLQVTRMEKDDVYKLMQAVNSRTDSPLRDELLRDEFELKWPTLQERIETAVKQASSGHSMSHAESVRRPERDILEDLVSAVRELRNDVQQAGFSAVGHFQVSEMLIYKEVDGILAEAEATPSAVRLIDVMPNGQILLHVQFDESFSNARRLQILSAFKRPLKYVVQLKAGESAPPIVVTNTGGSRIVGPLNTSEEAE